jgi:hypothetical protein
MRSRGKPVDINITETALGKIVETDVLILGAGGGTSLYHQADSLRDLSVECGRKVSDDDTLVGYRSFYGSRA